MVYIYRSMTQKPLYSQFLAIYSICTQTMQFDKRSAANITDFAQKKKAGTIQAQLSGKSFRNGFSRGLAGLTRSGFLTGK